MTLPKPCKYCGTKFQPSSKDSRVCDDCWGKIRAPRKYAEKRKKKETKVKHEKFG